MPIGSSSEKLKKDKALGKKVAWIMPHVKG